MIGETNIKYVSYTRFALTGDPPDSLVASSNPLLELVKKFGQSQEPTRANDTASVVADVTAAHSNRLPVEPHNDKADSRLTLSAACALVADKDDGFIAIDDVLIREVEAEAAVKASVTAPVPGNALNTGRASNEQPFQAPWLKSVSRLRSPLLRLHCELAEFSRILQPTDAEVAARTAAVQRITDAVHHIWKGAKVEVFGSFATGLYTPSSDIDLVVLESGATNIADALKALAVLLGRQGVAKDIEVIAKARVPIAKFKDATTGLNFDISFDIDGGPKAAAMVSTLMASWPAVRPLVLLLKVFLTQRELNEVYLGGIGSYALLVMVAASLQMHRSRQPTTLPVQTSKKRKRGGGERHERAPAAAELEGCLGVLLVDFLRLYGRAMNYEEAGISVRDGGSFFSKVEKDWASGERPHLLALEDPQDPTNDVGRSSYGSKVVRSAFDHAYSALTAPSRPCESVLGRIVDLEPLLQGRQWAGEEAVREASGGGVEGAPVGADDVAATVGKSKRHKAKVARKAQRAKRGEVDKEDDMDEERGGGRGVRGSIRHKGADNSSRKQAGGQLKQRDESGKQSSAGRHEASHHHPHHQARHHDHSGRTAAQPSTTSHHHNHHSSSSRYLPSTHDTSSHHHHHSGAGGHSAYHVQHAHAHGPSHNHPSTTLPAYNPHQHGHRSSRPDSRSTPSATRQIPYDPPFPRSQAPAHQEYHHHQAHHHQHHHRHQQYPSSQYQPQHHRNQQHQQQFPLTSNQTGLAPRHKRARHTYIEQ